MTDGDAGIMTDGELIRACQSGTKNSFAELVKQYYQQAFSMAYYYVHNRETALDISQEAFVRVYRNIQHFDTSKSFAPYLFRIIKNLCVNDLQRRRRRWLVFSDYARSDTDFEQNIPAAADDALERKERQEMVWRGLNKLPEQDREILVLKEFEDFSYKDISEALDIPIGTVMSRLYYARKKLAGLLEGEYAEL